MKQIAIFVILGVISFPIQARDWHDFCQFNSSIAKTVMTARQSGVAMSKTMKAVREDAPEELAAVAGVLEKLVIKAYESPRYSTKENQTRSIAEFRDQTYLVCTKAFLRAGKS